MPTSLISLKNILALLIRLGKNCNKTRQRHSHNGECTKISLRVSEYLPPKWNVTSQGMKISTQGMNKIILADFD